ncbi:hypothetical protein A9Q93_09920 [Nonlabens dokdonensis]|uniref:DUF4258 domain-containing protein n=1 Tax=Nonlabens dokdonensis TaxID=328515 RepID=A0A1Z8ARD5_9FLAO|nr:DUF4258 domain-containing protein [Nonlabens dokdonensis]OUS12910.1 hypothetical protein A9Q93_09920 [Nonlabens dokdonensis]
MKFIKRLGFYGGGFAIGMVFLIFFLTGKRTQCTWLPEDRVLNDIRRKNFVRFSPEMRTMLEERKIDTLDIQLILKYGNVDFSKSNTDTIPCNFYHISGKKELKNTSLWVQNCERYVKVVKVLSQ